MQRQLRKLGIADDTYDAIVSSGDLTRHFVADHPGRVVMKTLLGSSRIVDMLVGDLLPRIC